MVLHFPYHMFTIHVDGDVVLTHNPQMLELYADYSFHFR